MRRATHYAPWLALALAAGCSSRVTVIPAPGADGAVDALTDDVPSTDAGGCLRGGLRCGTACVDPLISPFHCGACDHRCATGAVCSNGACVTPCVAPRLMCGTTCVDTTTDAANCGACGRTCADGSACRSGRCVVPSGVTYTIAEDAWTEGWLDACALPGHETLLPGVDDAAALTRLPFAFTYWGTMLAAGSSVNVSSNGFISLDGMMNGSLGGMIPSPLAPNAVIAAQWTDLVTSATGVCVSTFGAAPTRSVAFTWNDVVYFSDRASRVRFEVVLYESNVIELVYGDLAASRGGTVGLESFDGLEGVSPCTPTPTPSCPARLPIRLRFTPVRR